MISASEQPNTAFLVVPLDVAVIVASDVLGSSMPIIAGDIEANMHWPRWKDDPETRHADAPVGFERAPGGWGGMTASDSNTVQVAVEMLGFTVTLDPDQVEIPVGDLGSGYAKGMGPLREVMQEWVERFCALGLVILRQPLGLEDPSPRILSRPSSQPMTWLSMAGEQSWIDTDPGVLTITRSSDSPWSERVGDKPAVERMAELASSRATIPSPVALLSAARVAAHRGRWRLGLMEMGTCLEAILTSRLNLPAGHRQTLGPLTRSALNAGIPIPADIQTTFVDPRNAAVHHGIDPAPATLRAAFEFLDSLIAADYPDFAQPIGSKVAHRPQRQDLHIVQPDSHITDEQPKCDQPVRFAKRFAGRLASLLKREL